MARYALIRDGTVSEFREVEDPSKVALHKVSDDGGPLLRPVVEDALPTGFRPELHQLSTSIAVERERVVISHRLIPANQRAAVKVEAQRRIVELTGAPDLVPALIKQINALMRGVKLVDKRASGVALTPAEESEAAALVALASKVEAIRARSNEIEALDPVPDDYDSDARWP